MTSTLAFARLKQKPSWPFLAITTSIGMLVGHIFHAMVNRIAKVEDDYYEYLPTVSHEMRTIMNGVLVMGKMYKNKKQADGYGLPREQTDMQDPVMDIRKIMKDVENFSYSHMTWKERKKIENRKVVSLGGKPPKNQRLPLSVARPMMKKQKEREQKMLQERLILGRFGGKLGGSSKRSVGKHKPEDRGLKSSEGRFKNGILDVRHLLNSAPSRDHDTGTNMSSKGKMKGGKMKQGKKGAGKKHH